MTYVQTKANNNFSREISQAKTLPLFCTYAVNRNFLNPLVFNSQIIYIQESKTQVFSLVI